MKPLYALAAFVVLAICNGQASAQSVASAYTTLDLKKCRHTPGKDVEDYGEWSCAGYGGALKPYATIMRWSTTVSGDADEPVRGQVLVVTRLGSGGVCHVGYVDARANPDANALAQKIADETARAFKCGADKPVVLGNKGPGFSGSYSD